MKVIPREARRITYSTNIRNLKKRLKLSNFQREVLIGSILGDGHLELNWSKTNVKLKLCHSQKQQEYIAWKYEIFRDWVLNGLKTYEKTRSILFKTISHPEFTRLWGIFYKKGRKIIPKGIRRFLSPVSLAIWFMDDGNIIRRNGKVYGFHLNTQSFSLSENKLLAKALKDLYGIQVLLERNHGKYRLRIMQKKSRAILVKCIQKYVIKSMKYKLVE